MARNSLQSIRTKITVLAILVCALPLLIVSVKSVNSSTASLENLLAEELMQKAALVGKHIDEFFAQRIADMRMISQADALEAIDQAQVAQYFDELISANPLISELMVVSPSAYVIAASGSQNRLGSALSSEHPEVAPLMAEVLEAAQGDVFLSDAIVQGSSSVVYLMTPITDDSNTIVEAVLLAQVPMAPVEAMVAEFDDSVIGEKSVYLLNDESKVIYSGDEQQAHFEFFNDFKVAPDVAHGTEVDGSMAFEIYQDFHGDWVMTGMADMEAHGKNEALDWGIFAVAEMEAIAEPAHTLQNQIIVIAVFCIIAASVLAGILSSLLVAPLAYIKGKMADLVNGGWDLTTRLEVKSKDEIGEVAVAFNEFVSHVQGLVQDFKSSEQELSKMVALIENHSESSREECQKQHSETEKVAGAIQEMSTAADLIAENAVQAADSAQSTNDIAMQGRAVLEDAIASINKLAHEISSATDVVDMLQNNVANIGTVVDVIRGIAEQTNLLALNAAIEAARAGEQGRGFAVVADEVRSLANKTQESTEEIQGLIERLQQGAGDAVTTMNHSRSSGEETVTKAQLAGNALNKIAQGIANISQLNAQIATASEQQTSVTCTVSQNVSAIAQVTESVSHASIESAQNGRSLALIGNSIREKVQSFKT